MILISHRGNINGPRPEMENKPSYILQALQYGFDCEIDVWFKEGKFYLGHDEPLYDFPFTLIEKHHNKLWIHCKDMASLTKLNEIDSTGIKLNYFGHDKDLGVLTSKGYIWSTQPFDRGILVMPEVTNLDPIEGTKGICSDHIVRYE
jgi:hypothetical protein